MLDKDAKEEFINNGVDKTHYRILWYDDTAEEGETYGYRVQAVDLGGQEGPWSDEITVLLLKSLWTIWAFSRANPC